MNREKLAWAAGFFDGEGSISFMKPTSLQLAIGQADERPLLRFNRAVMNLGKVSGPFQPSLGVVQSRKPYWRWNLARWRDVQAVVAMLWPFLSEPKREQFTRVIRRFNEEAGPRLRAPFANGVVSRCLRGHDLSQAYINAQGHRVCRPCQRIRQPRYVKKPPCVDCGAPRSRYALRCRSCAAHEWQTRAS